MITSQQKIITIPKLELLAIQTDITKSFSKNSTIIKNLWHRFNRELHQIGNRKIDDDNWEKFGITLKENNKYYYLCAVKNESTYIPPKSMLQNDFEAANYLQFEHCGDLNSIKNTINEIFRNHIPKSEYSLDNEKDRSVVVLERYDKRFVWNDKNSIIELFIPVKIK